MTFWGAGSGRRTTEKRRRQMTVRRGGCFHMAQIQGSVRDLGGRAMGGGHMCWRRDLENTSDPWWRDESCGSVGIPPPIPSPSYLAGISSTDTLTRGGRSEGAPPRTGMYGDWKGLLTAQMWRIWGGGWRTSSCIQHACARRRRIGGGGLGGREEGFRSACI